MRHGFGEVVARARHRPDAAKRTSPRSSRARPRRPVLLRPRRSKRAKRRSATISIHERAQKVLDEGHPSFIKLGQIVSTRKDVLPAEPASWSSKSCRTTCRPSRSTRSRRWSRKSPSASIGELFVRFDEKPLARASIGQMHRAVVAMPDGEHQVVVKVQHPGVAEDRRARPGAAPHHGRRRGAAIPTTPARKPGPENAAVRPVRSPRSSTSRPRPTTPSASPRTSRATTADAFPQGLPAGVEKRRADASSSSTARSSTAPWTKGPAARRSHPPPASSHQDDLRARLLPRRSARGQRHHMPPYEGAELRGA